MIVDVMLSVLLCSLVMACSSSSMSMLTIRQLHKYLPVFFELFLGDTHSSKCWIMSLQISFISLPEPFILRDLSSLSFSSVKELLLSGFFESAMISGLWSEVRWKHCCSVFDPLLSLSESFASSSVLMSRNKFHMCFNPLLFYNILFLTIAFKEWFNFAMDMLDNDFSLNDVILGAL